MQVMINAAEMRYLRRIVGVTKTDRCRYQSKRLTRRDEEDMDGTDLQDRCRTRKEVKK